MDIFGWYPSYIAYTERSRGKKYSTGVYTFIDNNDVRIKYEAKYDEQVESKSIL
jgi:hypothetical protein